MNSSTLLSAVHRILNSGPHSLAQLMDEPLCHEPGWSARK